MLETLEPAERICAVGRRMYDRGYVAANDGNISVRVGEGRFLCTPAGVSKGFLRPEDLVTVDPSGRQIDGDGDVTSEIRMHLAIYACRADIAAVVHAHCPHATAFAISGQELPTGILPEADFLLGRVPTAPFALPGTDAVPESILPWVRRGANTILLANHGPVAFDTSLTQAYFHLETVEMYCRVLLLNGQIGVRRPLAPEHVAALLDRKRQLGMDDVRFHEDG